MQAGQRPGLYLTWQRKFGMWKIKHIFDGDYGCEALPLGEKPKVSVTIVNDAGEEKRISVEDDWLTENNLDVGAEWPEE